jgi:type II secretory pathway component PulK
MPDLITALQGDVRCVWFLPGMRNVMSRMKRKKNPFGSERGIAMLLVLWVIMFLAFICAEFSWTMRTETATTINFKEGTQAYYAAEAGINRAIIELLRASAGTREFASDDSSTDDTEDTDDIDVTDDMGDANDSPDGDIENSDDVPVFWFAGGGPYRFELGDFYCEVSIIDESNKININDFLQQSKQDPTKLKNLLEERIGLEGDERDMVADALIDWWDKDNDVTGVFGAEDSYYESLDVPYFCRNADLPTIEDCLSVRGVTEEIFYGRGRAMEERVSLGAEELEQLISGGDFFDPEEDEEEYFDMDGISSVRLGLADIFSVNSKTSSVEINVNTASFEQLMLVEGMQPDSAQEIIDERTLRPFENPYDRLPQYANYEVWKNVIRVEQPYDLNNYIVHARGFSRDGRISRSIQCSLLVSSSECSITDWRID